MKIRLRPLAFWMAVQVASWNTAYGQQPENARPETQFAHTLSPTVNVAQPMTVQAKLNEAQDSIHIPKSLRPESISLTMDSTATTSPQDESRPKKISLDSIIGPLKPQQEIFSKLNISPTEITSTSQAGPEQRLEYLPDGSAAAWQDDVYCWTAPGFSHNPLYFEQVNLERYGQGTYSCLQPAASAAQFFGTIPILPYKMGGQEWYERVHTLGHRRPGNCNPYQIHYHPFSWRGVTYQAAVTTGVVFLVP